MSVILEDSLQLEREFSNGKCGRQEQRENCQELCDKRQSSNGTRVGKQAVVTLKQMRLGFSTLPGLCEEVPELEF